MLLVELESDCFEMKNEFVILSRVAYAIARAARPNNWRDLTPQDFEEPDITPQDSETPDITPQAPEKVDLTPQDSEKLDISLLDAERKIFRRINAGIQQGLLKPLNPYNLTPLSKGDYGIGIIPFDELIHWGHTTKLFDFKMATDTPPSNSETGTTQTTDDQQKHGASDTVDGEQASMQPIDDGQELPKLPPYLTTSDLVGCFGGYMGVENPAKVLSGYPRWATKNGALVHRGKRGKPTKENPNVSAWNPVQFALNLLGKKPIPTLSGLGKLKQEHLNTAFGIKSLTEWKPFWTNSKPL